MRLFINLGAVLLLSACASVAPIRDANNINDKVNFSMDSRFGVKYVENGNDKSLTGKMQWEETRGATDITLATPLGTSMANLHITPQEAVLKTASGEMFSEKTPEELLDRLLGYELPFSHIRDMIGSSDKGLADAMGVDGWEVSVLDRFNNQNLAKKLLITRQKPAPLTMTLVIDERSDAPNE